MKMKRIALRPRSIRAFVQNTLPEDSFEQNIAIRSFVGTLFQASSTCTQERRGTDGF